MTYKDIDEAIEKSGNNLHIRVAEFLKKNGWNVFVSTYYRDDLQDVPREIDIIAQKLDIVPNPFSMNSNGRTRNLNTVLVIECKYFTDDVVFRIFPNDKDKVNEALLWEKISKQEVFDMNNSLIQHRYNDIEYIAVLYDAVKEKDAKDIFSSLTQPIKALNFLKNSNVIEGEVIVYYPVVVYGTQHKVYTLDGNDVSQKKEIKQLIFGLNYAYQDKTKNISGNQFYYIDFLHECELGGYIGSLEKDLEPIKKKLRDQLVQEGIGR